MLIDVGFLLSRTQAGDVVTVNPIDVINQTGGGGPAAAVFTVNTDGSITEVNHGAGDNTGMIITPVGTFLGTYHIKWEDHSTLANPDTVPFAKSTWQPLASGPYTWSTLASALANEQRGITLHVSDDGGTSTLDSAEINIQSDDTP